MAFFLVQVIELVAAGNVAKTVLEALRQPLEKTFGQRVKLGTAIAIPAPSCVMHFSNSLRDTDIKGWAFCARRQGKLG